MLENKINCMGEDSTDATLPGAKRKPARNQHRRQETRHGIKAEETGWLCQDLGRHGDAQFWSDRSLRWSREAGDGAFVSYVWMRHSDLAEERVPAPRVVELVRSAGRVGVLGPRSRALVTQQEAAALALAGDAGGFERMVDVTREHLAAAVASDDAPWGSYCTPVYVAMQEATGWLRLGRPARAVTVFERDIAGLPATDRVDAAVFRARLALAYARDEQPDRAAQAALQALDLAMATGSVRAARELARVRRLTGHSPATDAAARFAAVYDAHARVMPSAGRGGRDV